MAKNVKLTEMAKLVMAIADPEQEVSAITKKSLEDFRVTGTVEGIKKVSDAVYADIAAMVMLRESKGTAEEDLPALKAAEEKARKSMAMWFYGLGSRDPNKADGKRPRGAAHSGSVCPEEQGGADGFRRPAGVFFACRPQRDDGKARGTGR